MAFIVVLFVSLISRLVSRVFWMLTPGRGVFLLFSCFFLMVRFIEGDSTVSLRVSQDFSGLLWFGRWLDLAYLCERMFFFGECKLVSARLIDTHAYMNIYE